MGPDGVGFSSQGSSESSPAAAALSSTSISGWVEEAELAGPGMAVDESATVVSGGAGFGGVDAGEEVVPEVAESASSASAREDSRGRRRNALVFFSFDCFRCCLMCPLAFAGVAQEVVSGDLGGVSGAVAKVAAEVEEERVAGS